MLLLTRDAAAAAHAWCERLLHPTDGLTAAELRRREQLDAPRARAMTAAELKRREQALWAFQLGWQRAAAQAPEEENEEENAVAQALEEEN